MHLVEILTIIALIAGPSFAVCLTLWYQRREFVRQQQMNVFKTLIALRAEPFNVERIRGLGLIDVVFHHQKGVRVKWAEYFESLNNPGLNDANGALIRLGKYNDLLSAMAIVLGYGRDFGFAELTRVYSPQLMATANQIQSETAVEWLRLLKASENLGTARQSGGTVTSLPQPPPVGPRFPETGQP